jgi:hypothetical protein
LFCLVVCLLTVSRLQRLQSQSSGCYKPPLSLVRIIEELLERTVAAPV